MFIFLLIAITSATNYYEILGVAKDATNSEIKKAYRSLSIKYHPDKPTGDKKKYEQLNKAYEVLTDAKQRRIYDQGGEEALKNAGRDGGFGGGFNPFDFFHNNNRQQQRQQRMPDVVISLEVTLEDLYKGKTIEVLHKKRQLCSHCHGTGGDTPDDVKECPVCHGTGVKTETRHIGPGFVQQFQTTCGHCGGKGKIYGKKCHLCGGKKVEEGENTISVGISKGLRDGEEIRFEGFGDEKPGFETGDVIFKIKTIPNANFIRKGDDLHITQHITLKESLLGFEKEITHLDGHIVKIRRDGVTPYGYVMSVKDEGMPVKRRVTKGNLIVSIIVDFPTNLTSAQQETVKKLF
ncbi:Chaperone protein DNAJ [Entamoeba marina]